MTPRSLVRQIGDAGARIWLNGESVRVAANGPLPNAIVEQLRREKPEVVEVLRLLPVCCECGAKVLEPVIAWWGGAARPPRLRRARQALRVEGRGAIGRREGRTVINSPHRVGRGGTARRVM